MRAAAAVVVALVLVGGTGCSKRAVLPPGTFAGSTASGAELVVEVGTSKVTVNGTEATLRADGSLVARKLPDRPRLLCQPQAKGEELRCEMDRGAEHEVVELMRL